MTGTVAQRLAAAGIVLPTMAPPLANYVPFTVAGGFVHVSGQLPTVAGAPIKTGKLGEAVSIDEGRACARQCAINILAALAAATAGELDRIRAIVQVTGFVACTPTFTDHPQVINGASELMVEILGDAGRHARAAVGVPSLPRDVPVEVAAVAWLG